MSERKDGMEREARELVEQLDHGIVRLDNRCNCGRPYITAVKNTPEDERIIAAALARCANEARLEALEQAAVIADDADTATTNEANCAPYDHADAASATFYSGEANTAIEIAAAIRALKAAQHGEKELRKGK